MTDGPGALKGRTALVTGGGRGIGRAVALALSGAGAGLVLCGRTAAALDSVAAEVSGSPAVACYTVDVADPEAVLAALDRIRVERPLIDILVNNAGIAESEPLSRTDLALWQRHLAVNATAPYLFTRAVLPGMLARRWGRVVNIASNVGLEGGPYIAAYSASKHALVGFTRSMAAEVAGRGVTVNAVCPGFVATDLASRAATRISEKTGQPFAQAMATLARLNESGRLIQPDEVAQVVLALASEAAAGRTGETVVLS